MISKVSSRCMRLDMDLVPAGWPSHGSLREGGYCELLPSATCLSKAFQATFRAGNASQKGATAVAALGGGCYNYSGIKYVAFAHITGVLVLPHN